MKLEDIIANTLLISEMRKDEKTDIEFDTENNFVLITAGLFKRVKYNEKCLAAIYSDLRDSHPHLATKIMAKILGAKNEV
jgi:hypothetical protein